MDYVTLSCKGGWEGGGLEGRDVGQWGVGGGRVAMMFVENGNRALFVTPKTHQQTEGSCDTLAQKWRLLRCFV